jgi:hypothetical protein
MTSPQVEGRRDTSKQLRLEAESHMRDADFHANDAAKHSGRASHLRKTGDVEGARVAEIQQQAAERCEERALFRAMGCRLAASAIEHQAARTAALTEIGRAA